MDLDDFQSSFYRVCLVLNDTRPFGLMMMVNHDNNCVHWRDSTVDIPVNGDLSFHITSYPLLILCSKLTLHGEVILAVSRDSPGAGEGAGDLKGYFVG